MTLSHVAHAELSALALLIHVLVSFWAASCSSERAVVCAVPCSCGVASRVARVFVCGRVSGGTDPCAGGGGSGRAEVELRTILSGVR